MINYAPLWKTLADKGETTYTLINKYGIDRKLIHKLKHNQNVTIQTIERICLALECDIQNVVRIEK